MKVDSPKLQRLVSAFITFGLICQKGRLTINFVSEMRLTIAQMIFYWMLICGKLIAQHKSQQRPHTMVETDDDLYSKTYTNRVRKAIGDIIPIILRNAYFRFGSKDFKQYGKRGNYKDALRDFRKFNPADVEKDGPVLRGRVGETVLELHNHSKKGQRKTQSADLRIYLKDANRDMQLTVHYFPKQ